MHWLIAFILMLMPQAGFFAQNTAKFVRANNQTAYCAYPATSCSLTGYSPGIAVGQFVNVDVFYYNSSALTVAVSGAGTYSEATAAKQCCTNGIGWDDCHLPSASSAVTTITATLTGGTPTGGLGLDVRSYNNSFGSPVTLDVATALCDATSTVNRPGASLSLTNHGGRELVIQWVEGLGGLYPTAISAPYQVVNGQSAEQTDTTFASTAPTWTLLSASVSCGGAAAFN